MLLEIQISVENWNYKLMKHIYSEDFPSHWPLCRTSVVTKELVREVWVSAALRYMHIHLHVFFHYFALFLSLIILNQTGRKGQKQLRGKKEKGEGNK